MGINPLPYAQSNQNGWRKKERKKKKKTKELSNKKNIELIMSEINSIKTDVCYRARISFALLCQQRSELPQEHPKHYYDHD